MHAWDLNFKPALVKTGDETLLQGLKERVSNLYVQCTRNSQLIDVIIPSPPFSPLEDNALSTNTKGIFF